jgi:hypothetical protein
MSPLRCERAESKKFGVSTCVTAGDVLLDLFEVATARAVGGRPLARLVVGDEPEPERVDPAEPELTPSVVEVHDDEGSPERAEPDLDGSSPEPGLDQPSGDFRGPDKSKKRR